MAGSPVSQTLYQILGVELGASAHDIGAAYQQRLAQWTLASVRDPNDMVVLTRAKEILLDPGKRAAYDALLPTPGAQTKEAGPSFLTIWGGWIVLGVAIVALGVWWATLSGS